MALLDLVTDSHTIRIFGHVVTLGPTTLAAALGWALFASGAFVAVRERVTGKRLSIMTPLSSAGVTLAAMSTGLGLLLAESYPTFAREFCFPYALLALAVAVIGRALQVGGRPLGGEE
jgi:hypothetical protein